MPVAIDGEKYIPEWMDAVCMPSLRLFPLKTLLPITTYFKINAYCKCMQCLVQCPLYGLGESNQRLLFGLGFHHQNMSLKHRSLDIKIMNNN